MKSVKNKTEVDNTRNAHVKDAVAMCKFMYWLKTNWKKEGRAIFTCRVLKSGKGQISKKGTRFLLKVDKIIFKCKKLSQL